MQVPHCGYCQNGMMIQAADLLGDDEEADRGADPHGDERASVPLRHVSADPDGDPEGCCCDGEGWEVTMTEMLNKEFSRRTFLKGSGALVVGFSFAGSTLASQAGAASSGAPVRTPPFPLDQVDSFLAIHSDNTATLFHSSTEIGQGSATGYLMIAAEELGMDFNQMRWARPDTAMTPITGGTSASTGTKQTTGPKVRAASAAARETLLAMASKQLGVPVANLTATKGVVSGGGKSVTYAELIGDKLFNVQIPATWNFLLPTALGANPVIPGLAPGQAPAKAVSQYSLIGSRVPRIDIPEMVTGEKTYVQNIRVPGMWHGRVVRPRGQAAIGNVPKVLSVDESSIKHIPNAQVIRRGDFLGVVAPNEYDAIQAAALLKVTWNVPAISLPGSGNIFGALRAAKTTDVLVTSKGNLANGFAQAAKTVSGTYQVDYHTHGPIGPMCCVADVGPTSAVFFSSGQGAPGYQAALAQVTGLPAGNIRVIHYEGSSTYGSPPGIDPSHAAAVLSQESGRPVRFQQMRWDEHGWDNYAPAMLIDMRAGVDATGKIVAYDMNDWHQAHSSAAETDLEIGITKSDQLTSLFITSALLAGGQYVIPHRSVVNHFLTTGYLKASTMRCPPDLPVVFASEQTIDELAYALNMDPVAFRRQNMAGNDLWLGVLNAVTKAANWQPKVAASKLSDEEVVTGRGFALCGHSSGGGKTGPGIDFTNTRDTASAVVADIEVNKRTGKIVAKHIYAALSPGLVINTASVESQIVGQVVMGTSRMLLEEVKFSKSNVTSLDWVSYPILRFKDTPKVTPIVVQRVDEITHGAGEEALAGPGAAMANAFFDATGVRIRQAPMTPAVVRATLKAAGVA